MADFRLPMPDGCPRWLEEGLPPLAFLIVVCALGPWWSVYELDVDEGFNLAKAVLVAAGHPLYDPVWSDQPPLLTYALAALFAIVEPSVAAARGMVHGFAAAAVWALYRIIRRREGGPAAWLAIAVLASGTVFQRLSVSVMIGLPAIALMLLAIDQALAAADGRRWRIWLSGALAALSLLTKLFTILAVPAALLAVILSARAVAGTWKAPRVAGSVVEWGVAAGGVFGLAVAIAHPAFEAQLVAPHMATGLESAFRYEAGWPRLGSLLASEPATLVLAGAGLLLAPFWRRAERLVPLLWLAVATLGFRQQAPVWYHHALLFSVPLAWIAGSAAAVFTAPRLPASWRIKAAKGLSLAVMLACAPMAIAATGRTWDAFRAPTVENDVRGLEEIRRLGAGARWMVTDRPMDAFRAGIPIPPPLAVYSLKREKSGNLTASDLVAAITTYEPALFSSRRIRIPREARKVLSERYDVAVDRDDHTLYVRKTPPAVK